MGPSKSNDWTSGGPAEPLHQTLGALHRAYGERADFVRLKTTWPNPSDPPLSHGAVSMRLFCNLFVLSFVTFSCSTAGFAQRAATDKAPATIDVLGEGTLVVPEAFRQGQPRSRIVQAEFVASAGEGDDKAT